MTFVLSLVSHSTVWLVVDRRISWKNGPTKEHGVKAITVEATDGVAVLGYAGLGQTPGGIQPSAWMARVLRGRNFSVEECLWVLADEIGRHFPPLLVKLGTHLVLAAAWVEGERRVYGLGVQDNGKMGYKRLRLNDPPRPTHLPPAPPRVMYTGTGGSWLATYEKRQDWSWRLRSLTKRHDQQLVSGFAVARQLAELNSLASTHVGTVGPTCFVLWRGRNVSGWSQQNFRGTTEAGDGAFPKITNVVTHGNKQTGLDLPGFDHEADGLPVFSQPDFKLN